MKSMTCSQLGGACDELFQAETFDEMAQLSQAHGVKMHQAGDAAHLEAMEAMKVLMQEPQKMQAWFEARKQEFEDLAED